MDGNGGGEFLMKYPLVFLFKKKKNYAKIRIYIPHYKGRSIGCVIKKWIKENRKDTGLTFLKKTCVYFLR